MIFLNKNKCFLNGGCMIKKYLYTIKLKQKDILKWHMAAGFYVTKLCYDSMVAIVTVWSKCTYET